VSPQERGVEKTSLLAKHPEGDLYARPAKLIHATSGIRMWIASADRDPPYPRIDDCCGTRRGLPPMRARLEVHEQRRPIRLITGLPECHHLRVLAPEFLVEPLAHNQALAHHDRTDERVGCDPAPPTLGQLQSPSHGLQVSSLDRVK
jgi:hypothetical protein